MAGGSSAVCASISMEYRNFAFALVFGLLIVFIITSTIIAHKHVTIIHCAVPTLLLSIGISYCLSITSNKSIITNAITNDFIYKYLLPVIVLTEGFNMRNRSVQTYNKEVTIIGILIPIVVIIFNAALLLGCQSLAFSIQDLDETYRLKLPVLLSIAITMNNVDLHGSLSPLMTIKNLRIYKILFSSGLLSNNMCLIFVMTFERMLLADSFGTDTFIPDFFKVGIFSIVLGLLIGGIVTLIMKNSPSLSKNPIYETLFVIIGAYLSYCIAHLSFFQLSGDVAIFFYGIMMAHYNKYNMSAESFRNIGLTFNLLLQFAEAICFIYIGLSFQDAVVGRPENFGFAGLLLICLLISRTIVISFVAWMCSIFDPTFRVKGKEWVAIILAGMIRGPMAYIFSNVLIPERGACLDVNNFFQYAKSFPLFIMQICVVFCIVIMIPLNYVFFHIAVGKEIGEGEDVMEETLSHEKLKTDLLKGEWYVNPKKPQIFRYTDEYYFKPLLIRNYHRRKVQIDNLKKRYDEIAGLYDHGVHLEHELHHENIHYIEKQKRAKMAAKEIREKEKQEIRKAYWRGIWEDYTTKGKQWKENEVRRNPNFVPTSEKYKNSPATLYQKPVAAAPPKQATPAPAPHPGYTIPPAHGPVYQQPYTVPATHNTTPAPTHAYTPAPTHSYTPAPVSSYTPTPVSSYTPAPVSSYTPAPVSSYTPTPPQPSQPSNAFPVFQDYHRSEDTPAPKASPQPYVAAPVISTPTTTPSHTYAHIIDPHAGPTHSQEANLTPPPSAGATVRVKRERPNHNAPPTNPSS